MIMTLILIGKLAIMALQPLSIAALVYNAYAFANRDENRATPRDPWELFFFRARCSHWMIGLWTFSAASICIYAIFTAYAGNVTIGGVTYTNPDWVRAADATRDVFHVAALTLWSVFFASFFVERTQSVAMLQFLTFLTGMAATFSFILAVRVFPFPGTFLRLSMTDNEGNVGGYHYISLAGCYAAVIGLAAAWIRFRKLGSEGRGWFDRGV